MAENPYWHPNDKPHHLSLDALHALCFEASNIVVGSSNIASAFEADANPNARMLALHHKLTERRLSELLLAIAVFVRTYDDIQSSSDRSEDYRRHVENMVENDGLYDFDGKVAGLREACNKIIHAIDFRPVYDHDDEYDDPSARTWFLNGTVELSGTFREQEWNVALNILEFLEAVLERTAFGPA